MSESDKMVAAIYAAAVFAKEPTATLDVFIASYEGCLQTLSARDVAAKEAATQRQIDTWQKN